MPARAIEELRAEVESQPSALDVFSKVKIPRASRGAILVGAGDSYAAALAGFYASGGKCIALDPYSLASEPEVAKGLEVCFISVSGKTASNVAAARKVNRIATRTVAITAVETSPLAGLADDVILLPMKYVPRTAGMLSFSLSLLATLRLSGQGGRIDFQRALRNAKKDQGLLAFARGTTYILGNSAGYAAALYAAAKVYEILGVKAHGELLEEFSHMEMFSLAKEDWVDAFSCFDPSKLAFRLTRTLGESGYPSSLIPSRGSTGVERLFHSVFLSQLSVLEAASKSGLSRPNFLSAGKRLQASDSMIY